MINKIYTKKLKYFCGYCKTYFTKNMKIDKTMQMFRLVKNQKVKCPKCHNFLKNLKFYD